MLILIIKQFAEQVRMSLISQLINGVSRALQKLLRYFNGTLISTCFVPFPVWPVMFCLNLNEAQLLSVSGNSTIAPAAFKAGSFL